MSMVFKLLKKEATLNYNVSTVIWCLCAAGMYYIPNYPAYIGMFYLLLSVMMIFQLGQAANDLTYSSLLPVRKVDTVSARFLYCGLLEIVIIALSLIACFVRRFTGFPPNASGIDMNVAFYGLQLIILSIINLVYLGNVYKNPAKVGKLFLVSSILYFVLYAICELPIWVYRAMDEATGFILANIGAYLTATDGAGMIKQLPLLIVGIVFYVIGWVITYKRGCKQFQKYDI